MNNKYKLNTLALALAAFTSTSSYSADTKKYIIKKTNIQHFSSQIEPLTRSLSPGDLINKSTPQVLSTDLKHTTVTLELTDSQVAQLKSSGEFVYIEEDFEYKQLDIRQGESTPYGLNMVQAPLLSDNNADLFTVCVIDSGYDLGHPDLPQNATGFTDLSGLNWYQDGSGHGTHVAGTIVALKNGSGVVGVLPNDTVAIHNVRVFDNDGKQGLNSRIGRAVDNCVENGANVINMSLGGAGKSRYLEERLNAAYDKGVLLIAAAGNDGDSSLSYPASYDSVMSVANVNQDRLKNDSSQYNAQVEIAAPGTDTLSTVPRGTGLLAGVTVANSFISGNGMTYSEQGKVNAELANCGLGLETCEDVNARICFIQRGEASFKDKAQNCENGGGVAAIIYNNKPGSFGGTLGDADHGVSIPVVGLSQEEGERLKQSLGKPVQVQLEQILDHAEKTGTSMASPHVAGVAALVWSNHSSCSNTQVREALTRTALDLGDTGRDHQYGYGLVQAKAASDYLEQNGCGGSSSNQLPVAKFTFSCSALACQFDATQSNDPDGQIVGYDWSVNTETLVGNKPTYTFAQAGSYNVTLTVTDDDNAVHSVTKRVSVTDGQGQDGCAGVTAWSSSKVYKTAGLLVSYNGKKYRNNWWHRNKNPEQNSNVGNSWKVWTDLGQCN